MEMMAGIGSKLETTPHLEVAEEAPGGESSSTSSGTVSHEDADDFDESHLRSSIDPYADVRERMEILSARDKARFAHHQGHHGGIQHHERELIPPAWVAFATYLGYTVHIFCGHVRDLCSRIFGRGRYVRAQRGFPSDNHALYAPLFKSYDDFFSRRIYHRVQDCFNRVLASNPGCHIQVLERVTTNGGKSYDLLGSLENLDNDAQRRSYEENAHVMTVSGNRVARSCLNLGSYNYLGFADDWEATCAHEVIASLNDLPISSSSCRTEFGTTTLHRELEEMIAEFLGKEDSMVFNMGFNTNATSIPALAGTGDLLISDSLNHTSIINGVRASGAAIRVFKHNDTKKLESILREAIIFGQPRTRRPWKKIIVLVEGIYSMEGEYCDLQNVVKVCKKYGAYVYLDEAHSIGAMGPTGRGCAEYTGVNTADIDVMMGTFTKSFGGMGGYIAASKDVIAMLRRKCSGSSYHNSLSPVVCQQVITSLKVITGKDGTDLGKRKIQALRDNANYFRMRLIDMGLHVLGHFDSPVIPVLIYTNSNLASFSRECYKRGLAVVVVGFPAVPVLLSRVRFCMCASHTREDIDRALLEIEEIANVLQLQYENVGQGG